MINIKQLKELLNIDAEDLKQLDVDQLRLLLGTFRFLVRTVEREINDRCIDNPLNIT